MHAINFRRTTGYEDPQVNEFCRDVERGFDAIVDITIHKLTQQWRPPLDLLIPYFGGGKRLNSPMIVRCDRAKNLTEPTWRTIPGGVDWDWIGDGQVRLNEVSGLISDYTYELTFMVVG